MLRDKISFLSDDFRNARAEFNKKMTGVEDSDPRWRKCTGMTNENMGIPIGTLYVEKYFSENTKMKVGTSILYLFVVVFLKSLHLGFLFLFLNRDF